MAWDFETEPEFEAQIEWMRAFCHDEIEPLETLNLDWSALVRVASPLQEQVKDRRLFAAHLGPKLGGQGFGQLKLGLMHEILGRSPLAPFVFGCQAPDSGNAEILAIAGTEKQKARWLRPLLDGQVRSCFSMTERDMPGADPTQLATRAIADDNGWLLNGDKWFASNASIADVFIFVAVTDPDAAPHRRASLFIVPAGTDGVDVIRDIPTIEHPWESFGVYGNHGEVALHDVRVPADAMLGTRGAAFVIAQQRLGPGRIHHCMRWLGQAQRAFEMMCERASYRPIASGVLGEHGQIRRWIADSAAEIQAARLMTLHAAWKMDRDGPAAARDEIQMIKYFGAKILHDVIDRALQVHGSLGYSTDLPLESMYRAARGARIYDGPDEVHRDSVARRILAATSPPADGLPSEHVPSRRAAAVARYGALLD